MGTLAILILITLIMSIAYGLLQLRTGYLKRYQRFVHVIVIGRADQSPRTIQHAIAFSRHYNVVLIAYGKCPAKLPDNIIFRQIKEIPFCFHSKNLHYICTLLWVSKEILITYFSEPSIPLITIVQNPPALPILPLSYVYCKLVNSLLIIDWHNYGSSILALKVSPDNWRVKLYWFVEQLFGSLCDLNLCVSNTMAVHLNKTADIEAHVFYDRPIKVNPQVLDDGKALRCEMSGREVQLSSKEKELVLVTSSSWTLDENFLMLWNALCKAGPQLVNHRSVLCIVTGKGPELKHWQNRIQREIIPNVRIVTMWLHEDEYPRLLSTAEVGVSLHSSSSGLDLPMKVQDMLGAGLPVLCYDYGPCVKEIPDSLDLHDLDAFSLFQDSDSLSDKLLTYIKDLSKSDNGRHIIKSKNICSWQSEWNRVVLPLLTNAYTLNEKIIN